MLSFKHMSKAVLNCNLFFRIVYYEGYLRGPKRGTYFGLFRVKTLGGLSNLRQKSSDDCHESIISHLHGCFNHYKAAHL